MENQSQLYQQSNIFRLEKLEIGILKKISHQ